MPVYLHYCGGELERVNYVKKGQGCCGEDQNAGDEDNGCCKDETGYLQNGNHFNFKTITYHFPVVIQSLFFHPLPDFQHDYFEHLAVTIPAAKAPPPDLLKGLLISTSVLRI